MTLSEAIRRFESIGCTACDLIPANIPVVINMTSKYAVGPWDLYLDSVVQKKKNTTENVVPVPSKKSLNLEVVTGDDVDIINVADALDKVIVEKTDYLEDNCGLSRRSLLSAFEFVTSLQEKYTQGFTQQNLLAMHFESFFCRPLKEVQVDVPFPRPFQDNSRGVGTIEKMFVPLRGISKQNLSFQDNKNGFVSEQNIFIAPIFYYIFFFGYLYCCILKYQHYRGISTRKKYNLGIRNHY
mmetsp:Transcript_25824/g.59443  ORF Transcript_25824/g.59443 Transcript_25824/m.59443 type:complete len:240 (-) Transcript_25824:87-806(-)